MSWRGYLFVWQGDVAFFRLREEHHVSVLKRRQELEQSVVKKGASKLDETSSSAVKTNDREKSKLG